MTTVQNIAGVFGSPEGAPMEDVLREMINVSCGVGNADLIVPVATGFNLLRFDQREKPLLEALDAIACMIGWTVEFSTPAPDLRPTFTLVRSTASPEWPPFDEANLADLREDLKDYKPSEWMREHFKKPPA